MGLTLKKLISSPRHLPPEESSLETVSSDSQGSRLNTLRIDAFRNAGAVSNFSRSGKFGFDFAQAIQKTSQRLESILRKSSNQELSPKLINRFNRLQRRLHNLGIIEHFLEDNPDYKLKGVLGWGADQQPDGLRKRCGISQYDTFYIETPGKANMCLVLDSAFDTPEKRNLGFASEPLASETRLEQHCNDDAFIHIYFDDVESINFECYSRNRIFYKQMEEIDNNSAENAVEASALKHHPTEPDSVPVPQVREDGPSLLQASQTPSMSRELNLNDIDVTADKERQKFQRQLSRADSAQGHVFSLGADGEPHPEDELNDSSLSNSEEEPLDDDGSECDEAVCRLASEYHTPLVSSK